MTLAPAPVTLDCKATPVLAPESRALVTVGRKAILGAVSVRQVPAERRAIRDIRRVSDLAAVDLLVLTVVDRRPARVALAAYRSSLQSSLKSRRKWPASLIRAQMSVELQVCLCDLG